MRLSFLRKVCCNQIFVLQVGDFGENEITNQGEQPTVNAPNQIMVEICYKIFSMAEIRCKIFRESIIFSK